MKKCVYILGLCLVAACTKQPEVLQLPVVTWIDEATHSDTIVTKYSSEQNALDANLYYARANWQTSTGIVPRSGRKMITIYAKDSIYLSRNNSTTDYDGPYQFRFSENGTKLTSQDFLLPPDSSQGRVFVRLQ